MNLCSAIETQPEVQRFLLVSGAFVRTGGMDLPNYFLADFLAREGFEVHVVSHNVDTALLSHQKVIWHRAPRPRRSTILGEPVLRLVGRRVARQLGGPREGTRIVVNGGNCPLPDVNWVHYLHAATEPMPGGNLLSSIKSKLAYRQFLRLERIALRRARLIIANSEQTKREIIRCYGIDGSIIHTVYYGTDPTQFYPATQEERRATRQMFGFSPDKYLIAFIGALGDRRKGFDTLFEAWKILGPEIAGNAELLVIGRGAELPQWRKRAARLPGGGSIRFLGFRQDVPAILRACDAMVAPTRYEAFGLAVLEALCCGLPAVVSRAAGVAERYPEELRQLLLEDPENVAALVEKLHDLVRQRHRWSETLRPAATALRRYTWSDMAHRISNLFQANESSAAHHSTL